MRNVFRKLAGLSGCTSGNATIMTAFGLPALIGAAGYGADTAQWYMWQRELQHAVDQAAIGGAWALAYDSDADYQTRATQEFDGNLQVTDGFDSEGAQVSLANYDGGNNNSVLVTATVTRALPFTGLLLNRTATISATAQAAFETGGTYNACLIALKEDGTTFTVGGSATVDANCGLGALSCDDGAINIHGSPTITTTSIVTCGTVTGDAADDYESVITEGVGGLEDIYSDIPIPQPDANTPNRTYACSGKGQNKTASLQPGRYSGLTLSCNTTFAPGIYFIQGGTLDLTHNSQVVANNVMFVLRGGATVKLGGQGNSGVKTFTPMEEADFVGTPYAAHSDVLAGMLIMEDKTGVTDPVSHQINGNSNLNVSGIFYLPNGNVTINGNSSANDSCFQISSYTLTIQGSAYLQTLCEYDASTELGAGANGVRLIA